MAGIDNAGNITGFAADDTFTNFFPFLLVLLGHGDADPAQAQVRCPVPASIAHASDKARLRK